MAHIHDLIDYTVTCLILHPSEPRVLLIHHKILDTWLPVGGHIELDEDPDQALLREVQEESGLDVEILSARRADVYPDTKMLYRPEHVDIHAFNSGHRHVNFGYYARALSADVQLAAAEHHDIRWYTIEEVRDPSFNIKPAVRAYAIEFLEKFGPSTTA